MGNDFRHGHGVRSQILRPIDQLHFRKVQLRIFAYHVTVGINDDPGYRSTSTQRVQHVMEKWYTAKQTVVLAGNTDAVVSHGNESDDSFRNSIFQQRSQAGWMRLPS